MEELKDFLSGDWSVSGKGKASLLDMTRTIDAHTFLWEGRNSKDLGLNSLVGTGQNGDEKVCAFYELGPNTLETLKQPQISITSNVCPISAINELFFDFKKTGLLIRYPAEPEGEDKQFLFSVDPGFFNQIGKGSGPRYSDMGKGLTRALAIQDQIVRHPEEVSLLIRYDKPKYMPDKVGKIFRVARGRFTLIKQKFFCENIDALLLEENQKYVKKGKPWRWEITDWEINHYVTRVKAEMPEYNKWLKRQGIDITPALIFYTSDTGDAPLACVSCICVNGIESKIDAYSRKHTKRLELTAFFDDLHHSHFIDSLPLIPLKLKDLQNIPAKTGDFTYLAANMSLANYTTGKRDVLKVLKNEGTESDKSDKSLYDVTKRILELPGKSKNGINLAKLTGAIIKKVLPA